MVLRDSPSRVNLLSTLTLDYCLRITRQFYKSFSVYTSGTHRTNSMDFWTVFSERVIIYMLSSVRLSVVCRLSICLSVVCNVGAPYLGDSNFRQCFYVIGYHGHP